MGLLDSVIGAIGQAQGGGAGGGSQAQLIQLVLGMLTQGGGQGGGGMGGGLGGLGGLLEKLQQGGLGDAAASWVSTGQNQPVSPDQLGSALGPDLLGQLARQTGLSHGDTAGQLSQILPQLIDQLTPHGQVPQGPIDAGGLDLGSLLGGLLKR